MTAMKIDPPACIGLLGGTGLVGRSLARQLDQAGYEVRILTRRSTLVADLAVLPRVQMRQLGRPGDPAALADALRGCAAVVNLVGILHESARASFQTAHVAQTEALLAACRFAGVPRFIQISALGAAKEAPSRYLRSKAAAEELVEAAPLAATILQPSVIFGREDHFLNLFAALNRLLPIMVLACPDARFQPIHVEDVARAVLSCLQRPETAGLRLQLGGPMVYTLRELLQLVADWTGVRRPILGLSPSLSMVQAALMEWLPIKLMTRDNVRSMQVANVCAGPFPDVLGFTPAALATVAPAYLAPAAGRARYGRMRQHSGR